MNKKKKKIIIGIIAVILVIAIVLLTINLINIRKNKQNDEAVDENAVIENEIDNNELNNENEIENETTDNDIENDNNISKNTVQNKIESTPVADSEQEVDEETIQKQETAQEKAISIAKKDWGEDNTVYFSFEGKNNGKYRVCVRKVDTTYAIRYYIINVDNGAFEIEE